MSNPIMDKLIADEKEAEKLMFGEEEKPGEPAPSTEETTVESTPTEEPVLAEGEAEAPKPKPKRENWKKRYTNYKTATDNTIAALRMERAALLSENEKLRNQVGQLFKEMDDLKSRVSKEEEDPFKDVFTQEDIDMLGPEAIEAMKKAALANRPKRDARVDQLEEQLREFRQREIEKAREEAEIADKQSKIEFTDRLAQHVPNLSEIDRDPGFAAFLKEADEASGMTRLDLFRHAVTAKDVAGTARFFNEYVHMKGHKESFIDEHIMPEGDGATQDDPSKKAKRRFHISEYNKFMDDVAKGRFRGREKEAAKLERMYDEAYLDGRLYE